LYAIAITLLIHCLEDRATKQVWYADDAKAGGNLIRLKTWWDNISETGSDYGYHLNASKTWLMVKEGHLEEAITLFQGTGKLITEEGKRHLGAAISTNSLLSVMSNTKSPDGLKKWNAFRLLQKPNQLMLHSPMV